MKDLIELPVAVEAVDKACERRFVYLKFTHVYSLLHDSYLVENPNWILSYWGRIVKATRANDTSVQNWRKVPMLSLLRCVAWF